jgi:hypothetical protein
MAFPETSYPSDYDSLLDRTNNVDMVDESDFDYHDKQITRIQQFIGKLGKYIGQEIVGAGIAGALSHIASGGEAFRFAARNSFIAGTLFSVGDAFDTIYQEKFRVNSAGRIWSSGGLDAIDGSFLRLPVADDLPLTFEAGRLFYKTSTDEGLKVADGSAWNGISGTDENAIHDNVAGEISGITRKTTPVAADKLLIEDSDDSDNKKYIEVGDLPGGEGESAPSETYTVFAINTTYEQSENPLPLIVGQQMFDASKVNETQTVKFRVTWNPDMTSGTSYIRLYDIGPKEGPLEAPILITELSTISNGTQYEDQELLVDASGPALNTIKNNSRIYEVAVYQSGTAEDKLYLGSAVLALEVESLPTGYQMNLFDVWAFGGM